MNDWARMERAAKQYKEMYPPGTRVLLNSMEDPYAPVLPGTRGTVTHVDDLGTIHMKWDTGGSLGLVPGEDSFRKLTKEELDEEKTSLADKLTDANKRAKDGTIEKGDIERNDPVL